MTSLRDLAHYGLMICILISVVSCGKTWTKPGFNMNQWNLDNANCKVHANSLFPPNMHTTQIPGISTPVQTNCYTIGGVTSCNTHGGPGTPINVTKDLNSQGRAQAWEACIRQRGYYQPKERKAAQEVIATNQSEQHNETGLSAALLPPLSVKAVETSDQWITISWKEPDYEVHSYLVEFGPSPNQLTDSFVALIDAVEVGEDLNGQTQHKFEIMSVSRPVFVAITARGKTSESFRSKTVQALRE